MDGMTMGVAERHTACATRRVLRALLVGAVSTILAGACGDPPGAGPTRVVTLDWCLRDSDCVEPLVCAFERCHERCESSQDCPDDQRCVLTDEAYHVCQLRVETACEADAECKGDQSCAVDAECRDECDQADDCVEGQECSRGSCADEAELTDDGELPIEPGHEPDGGSGGTSSSGGAGGTNGGNGGTSDSGGNGGTSDTGGTGGSTDTGGTGGASGPGGTTNTTGTVDPVCGNEIIEEGEECDDGNIRPVDGCNSICEQDAGWLCDGEPSVCEEIECDNDTSPCHADATCTDYVLSPGVSCECNESFYGDGLDCRAFLPVAQVVTGDIHTCARFDSGNVRCWGDGDYGRLGYGNENEIGDNELPTADVNVGGTVVQLAAGQSHTCALLETARSVAGARLHSATAKSKRSGITRFRLRRAT